MGCKRARGNQGAGVYMGAKGGKRERDPNSYPRNTPFPSSIPGLACLSNSPATVPSMYCFTLAGWLEASRGIIACTAGRMCGGCTKAASTPNACHKRTCRLGSNSSLWGGEGGECLAGGGK